MENSILLSIIIPTKNRYKYLKECLISLNMINSTQFEIIVQDNSDDNKAFFKVFISILIQKIKFHKRKIVIWQY